MTPAVSSENIDIATPDRDAVDRLVELWVTLAEGQREHGSHILAETNRATIRATITHHVVTETVRTAYDDDRIVGFVTFGVESQTYAQDVERGFVHNIYVDASSRGNGIGAALLTAAENALAEAGVDAVALQLLARNERARRFYRRHGYAPHRLELEKSTETDSLTTADR